MKTLSFSSFKSGLLAAGLLAGLTMPTLAGPMPQPSPSVPANFSASDIVQVRAEWAGNARDRENSNWRRHNSYRHDNWRRSHNWRRNDNWRRHDNHWRSRDFYRGSGVYFGLGFGGPAYRTYVEPRRYYRAGRLSRAHVQWCYNRYRSYRAYDNTFQPYNGPRQQCYSPY
jgi:hypothetical protein